MRLKRVQMAGFKTFAEKTELEFGEGVTAVIGPNGCGKSNVADAILWVLGEQNPRILRGNEGRDFIFSGTDRRKPLGMAEVKLIFDNEDGRLPVEYTEVAIARRVYRSGETQYTLNGTTCRLRDILDLLMDTGVGGGAYSFVSQREVDAVLSARAEDRRELFEEAAGIKKYRTRKKEALRKLDTAVQNITRVHDIVSELDRQRAPLEQQAQDARRYLELTSRLQQIEIDLLVSDAQKSDYELYSSRREKELDSQAITQFDADLAEMEKAAEAIRERLNEAERELDSARLTQQAALTDVERTESRLQLVIERGRNAEEGAETLDKELADLAGKLAAAEKELQTQGAALERAEADEGDLRGRMGESRKAVGALEKQLADAESIGRDRQTAQRRLAEQRTERETRLATCRSRLADTQARLDRLGEEAATLEAQAAEAARAAAEAAEQVAAITGELGRVIDEREALMTRRKEIQDDRSREQTSLDAARRLLADRESRLVALTEMQNAGEGYYQGVKAVLAAARDGHVAGSFAPVADILTVPEPYRVAIEVALGASAQDVVCRTESEARAAIDYLKRNRQGRATFLALPLLSPGTAVTLRTSGPGICGVASELVTADPEFGPVVELLLNRCVVTRTLDDAIAASRRLDGWNRIVTLDGEVLTPGGALTGGSLQGRGAHLIGRKGEIDDLAREIPGIEARVDRHQSSVDSALALLGQIETDLEAAATRSAALVAAKATAEGRVTSIGRDNERVRGAARQNSEETARLREQAAALEAETTRWADEVAAGRVEDGSLDDALAAAQEAARRLTGELDAARKAHSALEVEAGRLAEKRTALRRSSAAAEAAERQLRESLRYRREQRDKAGEVFAGAAATKTELEYALADARAHLVECEERFVVWRDARQALLQESFNHTAQIKEVSGRRADSMTSRHEAELRIARLEVRLSQLAQRLMDEYGLTLEQALAKPDPGEIGRETVNEVARIRREVRMMGQVNTGAVEEFDRLTERYAYLTEQQADLEQSRATLLQTIAEIDESTRGVFTATFNAVSTEFERLFTRLFGGGSTRLQLTNPDDLLETGIEIMAQPPGKRPQHLNLLSGGERALTAVALLFSFLVVRPSPFVVLDEVDAPLDGANVEKFANLVKEFSESSQFLVITHNPTTIEVAPTWYGIVMQEPGVSRALSYRVPEGTTASEAEEPLLPIG